MIRRLNQLIIRISQSVRSPWGKCGLVALFAFFVLSLFLGNSGVVAQTAVADQFATTVDEAPRPANFLGVPLWDDDVYKMVVRFLFDLFFLSLVVGVAYSAGNQRNQRYIFNFVIMNVVVFFICFTLKKLELELGMALGLFAIFAIIRYRTDQIDVKDMTYLFVVIGLAVINSLSNKKTSYIELRSEVVYEKLHLLRPENVKELYEDLYQRTGIRADRVEIKQIDFQNGTSLIDIRQSKERAFVHQEDLAAGNDLTQT